MSSDRDRLINIILEVQHNEFIDLTTYDITAIADYLLANGVIVPPYKVGQTVWYVCKHYNGSIEVMEGKISMLQQKADKSWKFRFSHNSSVWDFKTDEIGVKYFLTKEEAKEKLKELGK